MSCSIIFYENRSSGIKDLLVVNMDSETGGLDPKDIIREKIIGMEEMDASIFKEVSKLRIQISSGKPDYKDFIKMVDILKEQGCNIESLEFLCNRQSLLYIGDFVEFLQKLDNLKELKLESDYTELKETQVDKILDEIIKIKTLKTLSLNFDTIHGEKQLEKLLTCLTELNNLESLSLGSDEHPLIMSIKESDKTKDKTKRFYDLFTTISFLPELSKLDLSIRREVVDEDFLSFLAELFSKGTSFSKLESLKLIDEGSEYNPELLRKLLAEIIGKPRIDSMEDVKIYYDIYASKNSDSMLAEAFAEQEKRFGEGSLRTTWIEGTARLARVPRVPVVPAENLPRQKRTRRNAGDIPVSSLSGSTSLPLDSNKGIGPASNSK